MYCSNLSTLTPDLNSLEASSFNFQASSFKLNPSTFNLHPWRHLTLHFILLSRETWWPPLHPSRRLFIVQGFRGFNLKVLNSSFHFPVHLLITLNLVTSTSSFILQCDCSSLKPEHIECTTLIFNLSSLMLSHKTFNKKAAKLFLESLRPQPIVVS